MAEKRDTGRYPKKIWLILPILFLYGCGGMLGKKSPVIEVDYPEQVEDCRLLKKYTQQGGDFIFGAPYMGCFKNKAIMEAEKLGATHIMYRSEPDGGGIGYTEVVYAYECPPGHEPSGADEE